MELLGIIHVRERKFLHKYSSKPTGHNKTYKKRIPQYQSSEIEMKVHVTQLSTNKRKVCRNVGGITVKNTTSILHHETCKGKR